MRNSAASCSKEDHSELVDDSDSVARHASPSSGGRQRRASLRTPFDTPLRETNRDVMLGVLTLRAARTLVVYLQETNINVCQWLVTFMNKNPINLSGTWEDASGDTFLRKLLSMPVEEARWDNGCEAVFDISGHSACGVDPRSIAQRILAIRAQLAMELIQDMQGVSEDNQDLLRRSFVSSLENCIKMSPAQKTDSPGGHSGSTVTSPHDN